jgi:hypothetical protein
MAELPLAFFLLLFFFLFPLINLVCVAMAAVTIYFSCTQTVQRACRQPDFPTALSALFDQASLLNNSGLIQFLKLTPYNGYKGCGTDLYVTVTPLPGPGAGTSYGPNSGLAIPVNATANLYEYRSDTSYDVQPFVNMSSIPFIGSVPGLGAPFRLQFSSHAACEYPAGLAVANNPNLLAGGSTGLSLDNPPGLDPQTVYNTHGGSNWITPGIFENIENSGQSVDDQSVLSVAARDFNWTHTGVQVSQGDTIIVDYKANGIWQTGVTSSTSSDADGVTDSAYDYATDGTTQVSTKQGYMVGKLGTDPPFYLGKSSSQHLSTTSGTQELLIANYCYGGPEAWDVLHGPLPTDITTLPTATQKQIKAVRRNYRQQTVQGTMDVRIIVVH